MTRKDPGEHPNDAHDLECTITIRDVLLELLSSDDTMARRAAGESLALMGLKVGDGYAVYLVQVRECGRVSHLTHFI